MRYLVASKAVAGRLPDGCSLVADGEMLSFELPWTFGAPLVARIDDAMDAGKLRASLGTDINAFTVEGLAEPGAGQAYVLGGHIMRDMERFRPYAEAVPDVVRSFNGRFLARGGTVTPLAGSFVPERVVLIEFPAAEDALGFYLSDRYAPLLKIRLATTDARLVILSRSGDLPKQIRAAAEAYLRRVA
jgi:uncharacterized protein (DUF1330 family)